MKTFPAMALRLILLLFFCSPAYALSPGSDADEPRHALIIGNSSYRSLGSLDNPVNDARAMRRILEKTGFDVIYLENATRREMKKAARTFHGAIAGGGVGFFYYAGHGIEVNGQNYLVASDSELEGKVDVEFESLAVNYVARLMEQAGNRLNILVLDACRNDPFSRSGGGGLAPIQEARGMYIAFATAPGRVASDGEGANGLFTSQLIREIERPGVNIEGVFKNVREKVINLSAGNQVPWTSSSITGEFYFVPPAPRVEPAPANAPIAVPAQPVDLDAEYWAAIRDSENATDYASYLEAFPDGQYARLARLHLQRLEARQAAVKDRKARQSREEAAAAERLARMEAELQQQRELVANLSTRPADGNAQNSPVPDRTVVYAARIDNRLGFEGATNRLAGFVRPALEKILAGRARLVEELGTWEGKGAWSSDELFDDDPGTVQKAICERHKADYVVSTVFRELAPIGNFYVSRTANLRLYECATGRATAKRISSDNQEHAKKVRKVLIPMMKGFLKKGQG